MPSLLEHHRVQPGNHLINDSQFRLDHLIQNFSKQASDWKNLTAITCGGFAFRLGKLAALSSGLKQASSLIGLTSEVSAFRAVHSLFNPNHSSPWLSDFVSFGSLRTLGLAARNTNPLLAHSIQDAGMVASQHLIYALNLAPIPQGNIVEQLIHAEVANLQMIAGMGLVHQLSYGRIIAGEKTLELSVEVGRKRFKPQEILSAQRETGSSLVFSKESSWSIATAREVAEQYPRMLALQEDYIAFLRAQHAVVSEENVSLQTFFNDGYQSSRWARQHASKYPDLKVKRLFLRLDPLTNEEKKIATFLGTMLQDVERFWTLPPGTLSKIFYSENFETADMRLYLLPPQFFMEARFLVPQNHPIEISLSSRVSSHEEVVEMLAAQARPFLITDHPHDLHELKKVHPFIQMIHDFDHIVILDSLTPDQRKDLYEIYQSLRRLPAELSKFIPENEIAHIIEGTLKNMKKYMFLNIFQRIENLHPNSLFLYAWRIELRQGFPEEHASREELLSAFEIVFGYRM